MAYIAKRATRLEARYTPEGGLERCGYCRHFVSQGSCNRIIGPVSPRGWCKFFSQQITHSVLDPGGFVPAGAPSFALDFMATPGVMPAGVTFTRASTATYFNSAGVMQTAAVNAPRWDYNPNTRALNGLLIEEARTNLILNSANLAGWSALQTTWTANVGPAPDGTNSSVKLAEDNTNNFHTFIQTFTVTASVNLTFSLYAKAAENRYLIVAFDNNGGNGAAATFDLQAGTITASGLTGSGTYIGASMQSAGGGIYRCSTSGTIGASTTCRTIVSLTNSGALGSFPGYQGVAGNGVLFWGGQLEQAAFPTSYIPTTASAVTRSADVATIASISGRNATAESFSAEFVLSGINAAANPRIVGNSASQLGPLFVNTTLHGATTDLVGTAATANTLTIGAVSKLAANWASPNAGRVCLNAGTVAGATTLTAGFGAMTVPQLMGDSVAADQATGYMRRFRYWPRVLADTELQQVTT